MNLFSLIDPKLFCFFLGHKWTEEQHRPCENYKMCRRCRIEEVKKGWHAFSNWSVPYKVSVYETHNNKNVTVSQERQNRACVDCNLKEERLVAGF